MTGYIITAALQHLHTAVPIDRPTWRKSQATKDLEDSLSQAQAYAWLALTFLGLSLGCLVIISLGGMEVDTPRSSLQATYTKSMQTK